jgi:NAD(P)-dependent dehydrogenase (short-subunit alcohol dehydrogenase family)
MAGRLENKTILVTGSTTGVGEATARLFVAEGARVMVHGRDEARARQVTAELGDAAAYVIADLGDPGCGRLLVEATMQRFGALDIIVNNAALTTRSTLETTDAAFFDRMLAVNTRAPMLIIQAALPIFRAQHRGTVVNVGSINALCGQSDLLAYSISKGGMATMTRNLANAHAVEGIRINQINLGWVATANEIALKQSEGLKPGWEKNVPRAFAPRGYIMVPEEPAAHVLFWASDESAPANGCIYELDQYSFIGRNVAKEF